MKLSKLPDKGFKTLVVTVLKGLGRRADELSENANEEIQNVTEAIRTDGNGNESYTRRSSKHLKVEL